MLQNTRHKRRSVPEPQIFVYYLGCFGVADNHPGVLDASKLGGSCHHPWHSSSSRFARAASLVLVLRSIPNRAAFISKKQCITGRWCDEGVAERGQQE